MRIFQLLINLLFAEKWIINQVVYQLPTLTEEVQKNHQKRIHLKMSIFNSQTHY